MQNTHTTHKTPRTLPDTVAFLNTFWNASLTGTTLLSLVDVTTILISPPESETRNCIGYKNCNCVFFDLLELIIIYLWILKAPKKKLWLITKRLIKDSTKWIVKVFLITTLNNKANVTIEYNILSSKRILYQFYPLLVCCWWES